MIKPLLLLFLITSIQSCEPNCNDCSSSFCTACSEGFQLTVDSQCIPITGTTGCSLYGDSGKCLACQPTFTLINSICEKQYSGCLQKIIGQSCNLCAPGMVLINETCIGILNCLEGIASCTKCMNNFTLQQGICMDESANCMMADTLTGVCLMCIEGFQLMGYQCISKELKPNNCYLYSNTGCLVCKSGYISNQLKKCVIPGNSICRQFDQRQNCIACANENLRIINGSCIDVHCVLGSSGNCQKCQTGFSVKNGTICMLVDPNCLSHSSQSTNRCESCKLGYYVNKNGTCSKLPSNCAAANIISGVCIQCLTKYIFDSQGGCKPVPRINNCQQIDPSAGACIACNYNYYLSNGLCQKVSSLCSSYDPKSGFCNDCKTGYTNNGGKCIDPNCARASASGDTCAQCSPNFSPDPLTGACRFTDKNCASSTFLSCKYCNAGYYLNPIICVPYPLFCSQMSSDFSYCLSCNTGWSLINGQCVIPIINCLQYAYNGSISFCKSCVENYQLVDSLCAYSPSTPSDKNCILFSNSRCTQCSNRYYLLDQACVPVNPNCKNYSSDGNCTDCYGGYVVFNGNCIVSAAHQNTNCKTFVNQVCTSCYSGYYIDPNSKNCTAISPLCKTSDSSTGVCLSCFTGYSLFNGMCTTTSKDPNCILFDLNGQCTNCSSRFFMKGTLCTPINSLCKTYNTTTGNCLSCYPGYYLLNGSCLVGPRPTTDANCKLWNDSGKCLQCYSGYFLSANTTCMVSNPLCKTLDISNGACLTCYTGFSLVTGNCVVSSSDNSDPNCVKNGGGGICTQCYTGFYVQSGVCTRINVLCRTYNTLNGWCLSCYPGYSLLNGQCVIPQTYTLSVQDPYCLQRNGPSCIQCSSGYFPLSGVCQNVNPLCKTANSAGNCLSCYGGYTIQNGNCVILQEANIPFCQTIVNGYCQKCIQGYYVQTPLQCSSVSILCSTYDQNTGNCLSCISGYFLQVGSCIYPAMGFDQNCLNYDVSAYCSQCKPGFYLLNYICTRIDPFCVSFDTSSSTCSKCGGGKTPDGSHCT